MSASVNTKLDELSSRLHKQTGELLRERASRDLAKLIESLDQRWERLEAGQQEWEERCVHFEQKLVELTNGLQNVAAPTPGIPAEEATPP